MPKSAGSGLGVPPRSTHRAPLNRTEESLQLGQQSPQGDGHEGHQGEQDTHGGQTPRSTPKALLEGGSTHFKSLRG